MLNWTLTHDTIEKNELDKLSKFIKSTDKLTYGKQTELFEKIFQLESDKVFTNGKFRIFCKFGDGYCIEEVSKQRQN